MAYILLPEQNSTKLHSIDRLHGGHRDYPIWLIVCCWTNHSTECRCFQGCRKRGTNTLPNDGVAQVMAASDGDKNIGLAKMLETEWQRQRTSVTRLGDLLHFGQLFKTCGNNYFAQIAYILGNFCKGVKIFHCSSEIILGNFNRHLASFYWSHWLGANSCVNAWWVHHSCKSVRNCRTATNGFIIFVLGRFWLRSNSFSHNCPNRQLYRLFSSWFVF